jgi:hypothetical protein
MTAGREAARIGCVLTPLEIRRRPSEGVVAAVQGDRLVLDETASWLALTDLAPLKAAKDPDLRRRAWWIRRCGGWEAVIADLELLHDPDPRLAGQGRQRELPMYPQPTETQQRRITDLLSTAPVERDQRRSIAFAAGLPDLARSSATPNHVPALDSESAPATFHRRWWRIWNRPSSM